jgi:hypothetical protein
LPAHWYRTGQGDKTVKVTQSEAIEAVMGAYGSLPIREPGWVDAHEMAEAWDIASQNSFKRLMKLVKTGKAEIKEVYDPVRKRTVKVWKLIEDVVK